MGGVLMATQHTRRIFLIVPDARRSAFNTWWAANVDTGGAGGQTFGVGMSATGTAPATHWGACMALTDPLFKKVMQRLCTLASVTPPANWDSLTRDEKRDWLRSQIPVIYAAIGVAMRVDDNDRPWDDYRGAMTALGLRPVE